MAITRYLRVAEESAFAEEAASADARVLDPLSADLTPESEDKLIYQGMSGLDRVAATGPYSTSGDISFAFDDVVTPWFFKWALGGYSVSSGTTGPYTHTFSPVRDPLMDTFTAWIGKDITEHAFLGTAVSEISLEVDNEWAAMSVSCVGAKDTKGPLQESIAYDEGTLFPAHNVSVDRDATNMCSKIDSMTLSLTTNANVEDAQGPCSRFPKRVYRGALQVSLELALAFTDTAELERFWGSATGPAEDQVDDFGLTLHVGDNIDLVLPRAVYTASSAPASGREHLTQTVTARGLVDPANNMEGPIVVSVTNDVASYTISA